MFVMAYTAVMVVGPLLCSASMQVADPAGLLVLPAVVPAFFILLALRQEGAAAPGGAAIAQFIGFRFQVSPRPRAKKVSRLIRK